MALGLASGEIVAPVGPDARPVLTDIAASARHLAAAAGPGRALLTGAVWAMVQSVAEGSLVAVDADVPAALPARPSGVVVPGHAVLLGQFHLTDTSRRRGPAGPLIGRDAELSELQNGLRRAEAGMRGHLTLVVGEPGVGKTRLRHEVAGRWHSTATVLDTQCPTLPGARPYQPVRALLEQAAEGRDLREWIAATGLPARAVAEASTALGLLASDSMQSSTSAWALRQVLVSVTGPGPLVILLDDVQAASDELLDLLEGLVGARVPRPVFVVCLGRPELGDRLAARFGGADRLLLRPLCPDEARRLADGLASDLGDVDLPPALTDRVVASAGGNPLFIEQLVRHLAENPDDASPLPPALRALLTARLDQLPEGERSMLEMCSVQGETFWPAACPEMAGAATNLPVRPAALSSALDALIRRDLVAPVAGRANTVEPAFRFRHRLIRDAAYAGMTRTWRASLHENFAGWLARLDIPPAELHAVRGWHLEQSYYHHIAVGDPHGRAATMAVAAGGLLAEAARQAHVRGELAEEIKLLRRARELFGPDRPGAAELAPALAAAMAEAGDFDEAAEIARDGFSAAERWDRPDVGWQATVERDRAHLYRAPQQVNVRAGLATVRQAITFLRSRSDHHGLSRAEYLQAELLYMLGRPDAALECCQRQIEQARLAGSGFEIAAGLTYQAWSLVEGRTPVDAGLLRMDDLDRAAGDDRVARLGLLGLRAVLESMAGRGPLARESIARSRSGLADLGLHLSTAAMGVFETRMHLLYGDHAAARAAATQAHRVSQETADRWFRATTLVDLAHAVVAGGDPVEATAAIEAIDTMPAASDTEWVVRRATARSALASLLGRHQEAIAIARPAVRRCSRTQMLPLRCHATLALATALAKAGSATLASESAGAALALATRKQDRTAASAARKLILTG